MSAKILDIYYSTGIYFFAISYGKEVYGSGNAWKTQGIFFSYFVATLQSAERRVCYVPRQNSTFGDRSFAAAGPRTWNELPFNLRDTGLSLATFNEHLKTYVFSTAF